MYESMDDGDLNFLDEINLAATRCLLCGTFGHLAGDCPANAGELSRLLETDRHLEPEPLRWMTGAELDRWMQEHSAPVPQPLDCRCTLQPGQQPSAPSRKTRFVLIEVPPGALLGFIALCSFLCGLLAGSWGPK